MTASAACLATWCWPAPAPLAPEIAERLGIACRLQHRRGLALTFDDGPHPQGTLATLELLRAASVRATFFLVGEQVERWPTVAAEVAAAGHEVALHGYRHRLQLRQTLDTLERDLDRAVDLIARATDRRPMLYRPPYGVFSAGGLSLVRRRGLRPQLWSRWGRDWSGGETPEAIARRASKAVAGDVVLLHDADHYSTRDSWRRTVTALPMILERLGQLGEPFVTVSESAASRPVAGRH